MGVEVDAARLLNCFFFSSRRRHTRFDCDWSSDVCSSDLLFAKGTDGLDARSPVGRKDIRQDANGNQEQSNRRERSEEHTSELQSQSNLVCRLLLEKKKQQQQV